MLLQSLACDNDIRPSIIRSACRDHWYAFLEKNPQYKRDVRWLLVRYTSQGYHMRLVATYVEAYTHPGGVGYQARPCDTFVPTFETYDESLIDIGM